MGIKQQKTEYPRAPKRKGMEHNQVIVPLVVASIDEELVDIVRWMNLLPGVRTISCCIGETEEEMEKKGGGQDSFVLFFCQSQESLQKIAKKFKGFNARVSLDPSYDDMTMRYLLEWRKEDTKYLCDVCKWDMEKKHDSMSRGLSIC